MAASKSSESKITRADIRPLGIGFDDVEHIDAERLGSPVAAQRSPAAQDEAVATGRDYVQSYCFGPDFGVRADVGDQRLRDLVAHRH